VLCIITLLCICIVLYYFIITCKTIRLKIIGSVIYTRMNSKPLICSSLNNCQELLNKNYYNLSDGGAKQVRCSLGDVSFTVRAGSITEQKCDAIVNSTDEKLDLSRGRFVLQYFLSSAACRLYYFERRV